MVRKGNDGEFIGEYEIKDHKFMMMEVEKREKIIAAALKEFSKGYSLANTDVIVKEAGISKGLIFHYFGTKKGLFLFLLKRTTDIVNTEYAKIILKTKDFLKNIRAVSMMAVDMMFQYPLIYKFIAKAYINIGEVFPEGLPKDIPNSPKILLEEILENSDRSLFIDGIDKEKAQNIVLWTINGFSQSILQYGDDIEEYIKEFDEYFEILRKLLYK